jgi:hypothetical protein
MQNKAIHTLLKIHMYFILFVTLFGWVWMGIYYVTCEALESGSLALMITSLIVVTLFWAWIKQFKLLEA